MTGPPELEIGDDGTSVVVKRALGPSGDRIRHEAAMLEAAAHPGVVTLHSLIDDGDAIELRTIYQDGGDLLAADPLAWNDLVAVLAELAATLADLHEVAIAHGDVVREHVLVDANGHPSLCGFGDARRLDDADSNEGVSHAAIDIACFGQLVDDELDRTIDAGLLEAADQRAAGLRHVAALARSAIGGATLSMADVALRLGELAARGGAAPTAAGGGRTRLLLPPTVRPLAAVTALAILVAAWVLWPARSTSSGPPSSAPAFERTRQATAPTPDPPAIVPATGSSAPPTTPVPTLVASTPRSCEPVTVPAADVDGDGCPESWWWDDGELVAGGQRYALGSPLDIVAIGDWDCDGTATAALVTAAGDVHLFAGWATSAQVATAPITDALGAPPVDVVVEPRGTCDTLVVRTTETTWRSDAP